MRLIIGSMALLALMGCGVDGRPSRPAPTQERLLDPRVVETAPSIAISGSASIGVRGGSAR